MKVKQFSYPSATGLCDIYAAKYLPDDVSRVKAVTVINHGMAEHQGRYTDFIKYLTDSSVAVFMHDMANHGRSNTDFDQTGYFGDKNGYKNLIEDFYTDFKAAAHDFPDKKIVVFGHSMGSFIVRCFTTAYPDAGFDAAVYMGTGGSNPASRAGDFISKAVAGIKGTRYKSKLLDKLIFGSYNNKFEHRTAYDWLTRDKDIVDKYINDKYCGFLFSAAGINDLIKLNIAANSDNWYACVPNNLPIMLISGAMDPVGNYSKGVREIYDKLLSSGHNNVRLELLPNDRHEVLNELDKNKVYSVIRDFITDGV